MRRVVAAAVAICLASCAPGWKKSPHDKPFQHAAEPQLHKMPAKSSAPLDWWNRALHTTVVPLAKLVSPARYVDRLRGGKVALDINEFDEVPDSTWFTNRLGRTPMTAEQVVAGPNTSDGPADGALTIISGKAEGATPGVVLRDTAGVVWFVKFDPPAYPELTTGAEIIASRVLHAAGYHVPEIHILDLDLTRLKLGRGATTRDDYHRTVELTHGDLANLVLLANPSSRGTARALFSRAVPGTPIGPFTYRGVRADDPNDRIPHERRRTLRGLWLLSAWINNTDTRSHNSLDTFVSVSDDGELGYVRHYLIDFGNALGATGTREKYVGEGYEKRIDWAEMFARMFSFGLNYPYWLSVRRSANRAVGVFESEVFDPAEWEPTLANPAFDEATARDTFWAGSIIARFDDELIAAAVSTAAYRDPEAAAEIARVLAERRRKVLEHAFERMIALDDPVIEDDYTVRLTDLEVLAGLRRGAVYDWDVRWNRTGRGDRELASGNTEAASFDLREPLRELMLSDADAFTDDPYITLTIRRADAKGAAPRIEVHLRAVRDYLLPVGVWREVR
jgi:hypothetical protein